MKWRKSLYLAIPLLCLLAAVKSFAHDTDLYMASGEGIEPNILIMFDNSGSMNEEVQAYFYDRLTTYDPLVVPQANRDTVYYKKSGGGWGLFKNSIAEVACAAARTALTNQGHYEGNTSSSCSSTTRTLRTGNYRNYLATIGGNEFLPKLTIAKRVIADFMNTVNGVRLGVMVFNGVVTVDGVSESEGGHIQSTIKSLTDANRTQLTSDINAIVAETWTPLAETLYESGRYFKGGPSYFNQGVSYTSPIQYHCQRNYVIIITDGESTRDRNAILSTAIKDYDHDGREPGGAHEVYYDSYGTDYLDDVAKYLYETDLSSSFEGQQSIITYTIGFTVHSDLLERTATHGRGRYFYCDNVQSLSSAFQNIVDKILEKSSSFVAPIVPVSRFERSTAGDKIYLALFQPKTDEMWSGNIKKYGVQQQSNPLTGLEIGDVIDVNGKTALGSDGQILSAARSYWSSDTDGGEVEEGGAGEKLLSRSTARNIYTYFGTNVNLTHSSNAFALANASVTPAVLGLESGNDPERDKLIKFVQGLDAYDDNGNGDTGEKREWILGAFLHSRPLIIHYDTRSVIYAGSNDGMLHAFDDSNGAELWAFIPPNLLNKLQALHADVIESFVDSSPKAYLGSDKKVLIFGQRRGGDRYIALDITNPLAPQFLWEIGPSTPGYEELGQTWSTPQIGKILHLSGEKWVAFISGGFDGNQDNDPVTASDTMGRAIYAVDVLTGALVWRYSFAENPAMSYSIPSDIARVDTTGYGRIDRLYVGDMGGQMWRFDIKDSAPANWTGKIIFKSNPVPGDQRKIFYPPDVTLEKDDGNYEMLFFGTGDREHPKESTMINRIYTVKDKDLPSALTEANLVDVTEDLLQSAISGDEKNGILRELAEKSGWYIELGLYAGEKSLSPPVVFSKTVYYTTFAPTFGTEGDPCYVGEGTGRVYALQYKTGSASFNLDASNDAGGTTVISRSDRAAVIGTAIPSGVIITFIGGTAIGYVGIGGGVYMPTLPSTKSLIPTYWKIVF